MHGKKENARIFDEEKIRNNDHDKTMAYTDTINMLIQAICDDLYFLNINDKLELNEFNIFESNIKQNIYNNIRKGDVQIPHDWPENKKIDMYNSIDGFKQTQEIISKYYKMIIENNVDFSQMNYSMSKVYFSYMFIEIYFQWKEHPHINETSQKIIQFNKILEKTQYDKNICLNFQTTFTDNFNSIICAIDKRMKENNRMNTLNEIIEFLKKNI